MCKGLCWKETFLTSTEMMPVGLQHEKQEEMGLKSMQKGREEGEEQHM